MRDLIENLALASVPVGPDGGTLLEMIALIDSTIAGLAANALSPAAAAALAPLGPVPVSQQGSANPPCPTCGGPTQYKEGTGAKGKWMAYL